ncbi:MAG: sugar phosphate isomerase/epimerase family protein [Promethearchaeota archaeon]
MSKIKNGEGIKESKINSESLHNPNHSSNSCKPRITVISDEFSMNLEKILKYISKRGLKYVELRGISLRRPMRVRAKRIGKYTNEELEALKGLLSEYGIKVSCLGSPLFNHNFPRNEAEKEAMLRDFRRYCDVAVILGCGIIRAFSFRPDPVNLERSYNAESNSEFYKQFKYICGFFREVGEIASEYGVKVGLENEPGLFGDNVDNSIKLIEGINHGSIGLLWDPGNMWRHGIDEDAESMKRMYKYVIYSHIKDVGMNKKGRRYHVVNGTGIVPYEEYFRDILEGGYDFYFSVETHMHGLKWRNSVKCLDGLIELLGKAGWDISDYK